MIRHRYITGVTVAFLALLLASTPLQAARILVIGDSWAEPTAAALQQVLTENEHPDIIVESTPYWGYAYQLSSPAGLDKISAWFNLWPDTNIVHLSIGANDMGESWTPAMAGTQQEARLLTEIMRDVETIVDHIFAIRPDVHILWSSYDFFRPLRNTTPSENNAIYIAMAERAAQLALTRQPGLTFVDLYGLFQVSFGFDGIKHTAFDPTSPIPPGDPSLPDPNLPSPYKPYQGDPSHPTPAGFKVVAQTQYNRYYASQLGRQDFVINAGLNDAWYNPATDGQGFFVTVFPDLDAVFLAWFTYDTVRPDATVTANLGEPGHRWLTAQGPIDGDTSVMNVSVTSGGMFDAQSTLDRVDEGTFTLTFKDCSSATIEYDIPSIDRHGTVPIERVAKDNVALCEALIAQARATR
jgi:lysophospholipase L1-like esterase